MRPAERMLAWYDRARRALPWRAPPGRQADPYRVWLSEIMLQQTVVKAAAPYFLRFTGRWSDVESLARAPLDEVLTAWAGLGYYARARNLHACARAVVQRHGGVFPQDEAGLLALPGVGVYTAAAIRAIAFDAQVVPVDGNVERVMARYHDVREPLPAAKGALAAYAQSLLPCARPGDLAQALMDLGASLCAPKNPACALCPLNQDCAAHAAGTAAMLPVKAPKKQRPVRRAAAFVAVRADGCVLLRKRPPKGLLGGMAEVPSSDWSAAVDWVADPRAAPFPAKWRKLSGEVRHVFTHFELRLEVWHARLARTARLPGEAGPQRGYWVHQADLGEEALPSVMRKILSHALKR